MSTFAAAEHCKSLGVQKAEDVNEVCAHEKFVVSSPEECEKLFAILRQLTGADIHFSNMKFLFLKKYEKNSNKKNKGGKSGSNWCKNPQSNYKQLVLTSSDLTSETVERCAELQPFVFKEWTKQSASQKGDLLTTDDIFDTALTKSIQKVKKLAGVKSVLMGAMNSRGKRNVRKTKIAVETEEECLEVVNDILLKHNGSGLEVQIAIDNHRGAKDVNVAVRFDVFVRTEAHSDFFTVVEPVPRNCH